MKGKEIRSITRLLLPLVLTLSISVGLFCNSKITKVQATTPTLTDLWNGNAHFELYMDRLMSGQDASGSNVVVVGDTWYWFHRNIYDKAAWKLGTVCEYSTDKGQTWSDPVEVIQPTVGTPWEYMCTDGNFYYDAAENKWRAIVQTNDGSGWTMSYFEREGSDPMGPFSTPSGFTNPGCSAKEIWSQITTKTGKDCVDIPGSINAIFDEGTPQIVTKEGDYWFVTFHGASSSNNTTQGYRGIAKTTDFQTWIPAADDCIVDQKDVMTWDVPWNTSGPIGVGAANIMKDGDYWYQIIEAADTNLNGFAGQHWPMGLMRSTSLTSTEWESSSLNPLFPATGQLIEWQYPTLFEDADGTVYCAMSKYAPDTESGFRIYKLVYGAGETSPNTVHRNVVIDPSFENGGSEWTLNSLTRSTEYAHTGSYSLKVSSNGVNAITSAPIKVLRNTDYILSGWIYKSSNEGKVYIDMNDISGEAQPTVGAGTGGGTWTYISQRWNSGLRDQVYIRCVADSGIDSPAYFDEISLVVADDFDTDGNSDEISYLYEDNGSSIDNDHRFADNSNTWTYKFDLPDDRTTAEVALDISNDYTISGSSDNINWTTLASVTNRPERDVITLDISSLLSDDSSNIVYLKFSDSTPANGWGPSLWHLQLNTGLFGTGAETSQTQLTWSNTIDWSLNIGGYSSNLIPECSVRTNEESHSGTAAIMFSGTDNSDSSSYCYYKVFDVNIPITSSTQLKYWFYPEDENGRHVAIDFICTDGTTLRDSGAIDSNGIILHPKYARGTIDEWNLVQCNVGLWLKDKTIDRILIAYDQPEETGQYRGYIDDIDISIRN